MKVSDLMLPGVQTVTPGQAIHDAQALVADGDFAPSPDEFDELVDLLTEHDAGINGMPNGDMVSGELSGVFANEDDRRHKAGEH